ncbi:hypothetical protein BJ165DRAFT_402521 [Panaeolus papilionaceus]|nr:hypothetical protein BJ165DRAFT_402521 [Panaeolus papilionaceus]
MTSHGQLNGIILPVRCKVYTIQPSFVTWAVQHWFDKQLDSLVTLELLSEYRYRVPGSLARNPRCLSTLKNLSFTSPDYDGYPRGIPSRKDAELSDYLLKCKGLERLEVIQTLAHALEFPSVAPDSLDPPGPHFGLKTLKFQDAFYIFLSRSAIVSLTPSLTSLYMVFRTHTVAQPSNSDRPIGDA